MDTICEGSLLAVKKVPPTAPPLPGLATSSYRQKGLVMYGSLRVYSQVNTATKDLWERLFDEGYRSDVCINTDGGGVIHAHASVLGITSPVMKGMIKKAKVCGRRRTISIHGVPHEAVRLFIRYLYSSCFEGQKMEEYMLHLLVLSHAFVIPQLKRMCEEHIEKEMLTLDNVVDIFQLSLLCDAPRLSLFCHRWILSNFKAVAATQGWEVMKQSHPILEKILLKSLIEEDARKKERMIKVEERRIYLQLYEAMEALVHICKDGCRTIGPCDKDFKECHTPCKFAACKGLELLVRHFAGCKLRVPGGCVHCKRMWQLLELHSHLCADSNVCRVPLCRNFKERSKKQNKKDEMKWKILVRKILRTKNIGGGSFFSSMAKIWAVPDRQRNRSL